LSENAIEEYFLKSARVPYPDQEIETGHSQQLQGSCAS